MCHAMDAATAAIESALSARVISSKYGSRIDDKLGQQQENKRVTSIEATYVNE